jgi:hypothetical protein
MTEINRAGRQETTTFWFYRPEPGKDIHVA